jgi:hypothetical protein
MKTLLLVLLFLQPTPRSSEPVHEFERQTGYPHGRPGYVVDHIIPLCAGAPDDPENMQWQKVVEAKRKDKFERDLCAAMRKEGLTLTKRAPK